MTARAVPKLDIPIDYFLARSRRNAGTGCWEWTLDVCEKWGYGRCFKVRHITTMAHRVAYASLRGPIPEGMTIDHLCRNKACVNPDHLEVVTMAENSRRAPEIPSTANMLKTHCPKGHPYDASNTYRWKTSRRCRTCGREHSRRYKARIKSQGVAS